MRDADFDSFAQMLDGVAALIPPKQALTGPGRAMYFRALSTLTLDEVRVAFDAHVRDPDRGRFFPRPADLLAQTSDGRPEADEAWAVALRGTDESISFVWTSEMATAWGIAKPVLDAGDEVGARLAFRSSYERIVSTARREKAPPQWAASLGHDPAGRAAAQAEEARLTGRSDTFVAIEGPKQSANAIAAVVAAMPEAIRERLLALKIGGPGSIERSRDREAREDTATRKEETKRKVEQYQKGDAGG